MDYNSLSQRSKPNSSHWQQQDYEWDPFKATATKIQQQTPAHQQPSTTNFRRVTGGPSVDYQLYNVSEKGSAKKMDVKVTCQVCDTDLKECSFYFRRYRVCVEHARASFVYFDHCQQRFCNRCGRFHPIKDFDDNKRSCRLRLNKHNERRRQKRAENKLKKQSQAASSIGRVQKPQRPTTIDVEKVVDAIVTSADHQVQLQNSTESGAFSHESSKVDSNNKNNHPPPQQFQSIPQIDSDQLTAETASNLEGGRFGNFVLSSWWGQKETQNEQNVVINNNSNSFQKPALGLQDMPYLLGTLKSMDKNLNLPDDFDMSQLPFTNRKELCSSYSSAFGRTLTPDVVEIDGRHTRTRVVDSASSWDFAYSSKQIQQLPVLQDSWSTFSLPHQISEPAFPVAQCPPISSKQNHSQQDDYEEFHCMIDKITSPQDEFIPLHKVPSLPSVCDEQAMADFNLDENMSVQVEDLQKEMSLILQEDFPAKLYNYTVKLYNTTPDKLPKNIRDQIVKAMQQSNTFLEFSMRPGCIEFGIFGINIKFDDTQSTPPSAEQVLSILLTDKFWNNSTFMLQDNHSQQVIHHSGISHTIKQQLNPQINVVLSSIHPKILTPGDALVIEGSCLEGAQVVGRMDGRDVVLEVEEGMDEFVTLVVPEDCCSGLLKVQFVKDSWFSNVQTVVVIDDSFEDTDNMFQDIGLLDKLMDSNDKESSFLIQLGLVLDYQTSRLDDIDDDSIKREYNHLECQLLKRFSTRIIIEAMKNGWAGVFVWAMDLFASHFSTPTQAVSVLEQFLTPNASLLHLAVNTGNPGALKVLFKWGNLNNYTWSCLLKGSNGLTPMHFASITSDGGLMVRLLMQYFPNGPQSITTPANDGKTTPLLLAKYKGTAATFETLYLLYQQSLQIQSAYYTLSNESSSKDQQQSQCESIDGDTSMEDTQQIRTVFSQEESFQTNNQNDNVNTQQIRTVFNQESSSQTNNQNDNGNIQQIRTVFNQESSSQTVDLNDNDYIQASENITDGNNQDNVVEETPYIQHKMVEQRKKTSKQLPCDDRCMARWDSDKQGCLSIVSSDMDNDMTPLNNMFIRLERYMHRWDSASSNVQTGQQINAEICQANQTNTNTSQDNNNDNDLQNNNLQQ